MKADRRAAASQQAADALEQAGRGLAKSFHAVKSNAVTAQTRYDLVICAGYINDALAALENVEVEEMPVGGPVIKL